MTAREIRTVPALFLDELALAWGMRPSEAEGLTDAIHGFLGAETLEDRCDAWIALNRWLWKDAPESWARLEFLLQALEQHPEIKNALETTIADVFTETDGVNLFAEAGLPSHRGLIVEFWDRLIRRIFPAPRDDHDLGSFLERQFKRKSVSESFREIPAPLFHRLIGDLFTPDLSEGDHGLRAAFADGFRLLAGKVKAQGLSADLRVRSAERGQRGAIGDSPFYRLFWTSELLISRWLSRAPFPIEVIAWKREAAGCRALLETIQERLTIEGVSVEIVYSLSMIEQCLSRMERMLEVMSLTSGPERSATIHSLFSDLLTGVRNQSSLRALFSSSMRLLHRKIVERSGKVGQHYIAENRKEYWGIWIAAAGGGLVTTLTMAIKLKVAHFHLPLFMIGLLSGLNYAVSFVILQTFGLVLATKQPAMTAARLAGIIRDTRGEERKEEIADLFSQISRSQLAAAFGNVILVSLGAIILNALWLWTFGQHFLTRDAASEVFHALSPFDSGTIFFAAWTGVLLWAASIVGGWVDNFSVYHRLPQAIRDHPLRDWLGRERTKRWADYFEANIGGWGTNISLGFLLGMTPMVGVFFGLPLEVRHVTLSTGQLAIAASSMQEQWWAGGWFLRAFFGIATMFVLNLSVSFFLSLFTAARAYELKPKEILALLGEIGSHFIRKPRDFFFPR